MINYSYLHRFLSIAVSISFLLTSLGPLPAHADQALILPAPGAMVNLTSSFEPVLIKGLTVDKNDPFHFNFIVDTGNSGLSGEAFKKESDRLVKYFFACLTIPEKDLWVNLSPYEKERIIPQPLGKTPLGRDLLEEDYILKQLTASLIYPGKDLGKEFWDRVYAKASQLYGTSQVPVNTFNKVWILADKATVYEQGQTAFVMDSHLKVMLDEDYLSLSKHHLSASASQTDTHSIGANIVRAIILPEIEKEVNNGKNFATLRQIFNSLILASWYKKRLKESLLNQAYSDRSTVQGVNLVDPTVKERIYQQYLKAYKKGVFNFIKEDVDPATKEALPRKYFSGGFVVSPAMLSIKTGVAYLRQITSSLKKSAAIFSLAVSLSLNQAASPVNLQPRLHIPSIPIALTTGTLPTVDAAMRGSDLIGETPALGISARELNRRINLELRNPGSQEIPLIATISDQHGAIDKFDQLLVHILKSVPAGKGIPDDFVLKPDQTLAKQLRVFGIKFQDFKGQLFIHNLGDFMDRGPSGVRVFQRSRELIRAKLSDFIVGNHDQWMFMNLVGFHLPTYDNFNFYDYHDVYDTNLGRVQFVLKSHHESEPQTRRAQWWAEHLAQFREFHDEKQESKWKSLEEQVNGLVDVLTQGMDKDEKRTWYDTDEGKVWGQLQGHNPDVGKVQTGVRAVGLVSIRWWEDLLSTFEAIHNRDALAGSLQKNTPQDETWNTAISLMEKIIDELKQELDGHLKQGEWWWRIFEAINYKNYESPEWWAQDWVFHEGWGTSVLKEINAIEHEGKEVVTPSNYLQDPILQEIADFYQKNYNLHIRDIMQTDYMHAFLPIDYDEGNLSDPSIGEFYFNYKGVEYRGNGRKGIPSYREGLAKIAQDVRKASSKGGFNPASYEALSLVNSWYADNTTTAKVSHVADALSEIGVKKVAKANGISRMMTGHLPLHDFLKLPEDRRRIITGYRVSTEDDQHFIFTDHGMGERFGGGGKYVEQSAQGLHLVGFAHKNSKGIVYDPPTILIDSKTGTEKLVYGYNEPIDASIFLNDVRNNIKINQAMINSRLKHPAVIIMGVLAGAALIKSLTTHQPASTGFIEYSDDEMYQHAVQNGVLDPNQEQNCIMYRNVRGWSLERISQIFHISMDVLQKANRFENGIIHPNEKILLPGIVQIKLDPNPFTGQGDEKQIAQKVFNDEMVAQRMTSTETSFEGLFNAQERGLLVDYIKRNLKYDIQSSPAMATRIAQGMNTRGGIDLNTAGMATTVFKEGDGVQTYFDTAMVARIRKEGIQSLTPVIYRITPITNVGLVFSPN